MNKKGRHDMAKKKLTPALHKAQIQAYTKERPHYRTYANCLRRVLEDACHASFPDALVQSRAKNVSSFAEKVARKFNKYPNAVRQMTDLCGARVIVQTVDQVRAVKQFIEENFIIHEKDDKGLLLSEDRFGYRDMHYVVQLRRGRDKVLGITPAERNTIGSRKAEIQVRTWVQHAWADTLHDRIYKNKLKVSPEILRAGNLLAALMEEGDRNFNLLADELDGQIGNYAAFATREEVEKEIKVQRLVLHNERIPEKKPKLALALARLYAAHGDHARVVELLKPYVRVRGTIRCELLLDLGCALCRMDRDKPSSAGYRRGINALREAADICSRDEMSFVPHLRKRESLRARAQAHLGWALEVVRKEQHNARKCWSCAHEHEPTNPYYLAGMLGIEIHHTHADNLPTVMQTTIQQAIKTCIEHAEAGTELPFAYFTAGRLSMLLDRPKEAMGYYARGIAYHHEGIYCVHKDQLDIEEAWLRWIHAGRPLPKAYEDAADLLSLAGKVVKARKRAAQKTGLGQPVLIIAGGARGMKGKALAKVRSMLEQGLMDFGGTVFAGGTTVGVPGCVGDIAADLA